MSRRTIIYLHSMELAQASWVVSDDEEVESSVLRGHLSDLSFADKQNEIVVVVPAFDVLLTETSLPKLNRQRLLQALPFALEEHLIDDVSKLHFAMGEYQNGQLPVAIVSRKKMEEWFALFKQYHIMPSELYSAVFLLPYVEKSWSASILQETATVRQNKFQGFNAEQNNLSMMIELALQAATEKPECIHIYSTFAGSLEMKLDSTLINEIHLSEQDWLDTIPGWINPAISINLLQGRYQPKRKTSETKKIWLYAGYATLAFIVLAFFSEIISFFILHHEFSKIDSKITAIYRKNFPRATSVVSPGKRMESKLSSLEEQTNTNYFLILLAKIGDSLSAAHNVQVKNLDFRDNQLTLEVTASKFDDLDNLNRALTELGLKVKQQNAAIAGEQVKANLIIQRGSA
jgi:general secretion pathway protein L